LSTVGDGCQTLNVVAAQHPDLVLMDLELPGINGLQSMALLREYHPATRVIIITTDDSDEVRATCLAQGADGFISKRRLHPELRLRIAEVFSDSALGSFPTVG
jgi:DNA-binding NarL/FixJ family response regulator